jgi:two-component system chemotaxis response regulator CheB
MAKIRVLVVDDAVLFRRLISEELARDPALDVVGTAADGRIALARLPQVTPDIVILDVEMPEMDGLATLKELRKIYPRLPVIMFSALTEQGAAATLDALAMGATDYFAKPSKTGGLEGSLQVIREQLVPAIKAICHRELPEGQTTGANNDRRTPQIPRPHRPPGVSAIPPQVLAIGTSTGGPNALVEVFSRLPASFPIPIVVVQHMPPMFTRLLAERLSADFPIRFAEGSPGAVLAPGQGWIAPGDYHMTVAREGPHVRILLNQQPPENSCRPAVDVLFRSVAKAYGPGALAVILTGMGQDGLRGCESIREAGGQILAQDEASSVVWGMPRYVAQAGLADRVLPLSQIGDEIVHRVQPVKAARQSRES